ncbi:hypothetical protein WISP_38880 [Willisornis vidua]|uniref:Uncharacterized protein n=1 Tax=Willisornis vidua TaxID=1566151 RepID=A0ABQ9DIA7_9PASS|nr:hypothetical protein WISP_38880 [Willisornis vidua]
MDSGGISDEPDWELVQQEGEESQREAVCFAKTLKEPLMDLSARWQDPGCYDLAISLDEVLGNGIDHRRGSCTSFENQDNTSISVRE